MNDDRNELLWHGIAFLASGMLCLWFFRENLGGALNGYFLVLVGSVLAVYSIMSRLRFAFRRRSYQ